MVKTKQQQGLRGLGLAGYAIVIVIGFALVVIFTVIMRQRDVYREMNDSTVQTRLKTLHDLRTSAEQALNSVGWVDQKAGIVHIPVEQALRLTLLDQFSPQHGPVKSSVPADSGTTAPPPSPATPPASAPTTAPAPNKEPAQTSLRYHSTGALAQAEVTP